MYFFKLMQPLMYSTAHLVYTVEEKVGKPDRKPYPLPYVLRNPYINLKSQNSQDYARTSTKVYVDYSGFCLHRILYSSRIMNGTSVRTEV